MASPLNSFVLLAIDIFEVDSHRLSVWYDNHIFTHGVKMDLIEAKGKAILMEVEFDDEDLDRLETDPKFTAGYAQEIVRAFRMRMQQIRSAIDERDFYNLKSLRFEKLRGNREGQHSIRLNSQWRLILEFRGKSPCKIVGIIEIVDYH